ncbi:MAG: diaminopimelate epimerase [Gammaproteobacteria bacterium GWE2_37_16]|nr:MAG: diaminopimelate epimerase [Gammaproteobacteria bacterium GWE2_37_16]
MSITFTKMQGLGNDFVVIENITQQFIPSKETIKQIAERHYGVGCDQIIVVEKPRNTGTDFFMRVFNADGEEAERSGNGARCFAKFVIDQGLTDKHHIIADTKSGKITVCLQDDNNVKVDMGVPSFSPKTIPFLAPEASLLYKLDLPDQLINSVQIGVVSIGNPHAVLQVPNVTTAPVDQLGIVIANHPRFPEGVNVGFMEIKSNNCINLRIYERGTSETLACGSGACAAVAIGRLLGLLDENVIVKMHGGELQISWAGMGEPIWMTGPAKKVFSGNLTLK